jgi:hypothetical protein
MSIRIRNEGTPDATLVLQLLPDQVRQLRNRFQKDGLVTFPGGAVMLATGGGWYTVKSTTASGADVKLACDMLAKMAVQADLTRKREVAELRQDARRMPLAQQQEVRTVLKPMEKEQPTASAQKLTAAAPLKVRRPPAHLRRCDLVLAVERLNRKFHPGDSRFAPPHAKHI